MKLFEKPWLEILEINAKDIVTISAEEGWADDVTSEGSSDIKTDD